MLKVKGHAVDPTRLYAAEWVRGALAVGWALVIGGFIMGGGVGGFKAPTYQALIDTFRCPFAIGAALALGGLMGAIGVWRDWRYLSIASSLLCAIWHGLLFGYTIPANLGQFGNSNLISLYALGTSVFYLLQMIVLIPKPTDEALALQ